MQNIAVKSKIIHFSFENEKIIEKNVGSSAKYATATVTCHYNSPNPHCRTPTRTHLMPNCGSVHIIIIPFAFSTGDQLLVVGRRQLRCDFVWRAILRRNLSLLLLSSCGCCALLAMPSTAPTLRSSKLTFMSTKMYPFCAVVASVVAALFIILVAI